MKFGLAIFLTDYTIGPVELARAAEDRGFESLFLCEHSHQPMTTELETGRAGAPMFARTLDPFVALTAAAVGTRELKLGTAVCLVPERDPIHLAKEVASLDLLSGGRVVLGVGAGWNLPEMRNHGVRPEDRWKVMAEKVKAVRTIWTSDIAEFGGSFVNFAPMQSWPKPVQQPHPPILVGGVGSRALRRVIDFGDGWFPVGMPVPDLDTRVSELRKLAADSGRPEPSVSLFGGASDEASLSAYAELQVERFVFILPDGDSDVVLRALDDLAERIR